MSWQGLEAPSSFYIPDPNRFIKTPGSNKIRLRIKVYAEDKMCMPSKRFDAFALFTPIYTQRQRGREKERVSDSRERFERERERERARGMERKGRRNWRIFEKGVGKERDWDHTFWTSQILTL